MTMTPKYFGGVCPNIQVSACCNYMIKAYALLDYFVRVSFCY